jgi:type IV pilus assembly protein PilA
MKKTQGFTLIELLAVIVILAIIALIATPTILGVIETARKGSAESSALGYIDAIEKQIAIDMLETDPTKVVVDLSDSVIVTGTDDKNLTIKGTKPTSGSTVTYNSTTGTITTGCLEINLSGKDYRVEYNGTTGEAKAVVKGETGACEFTSVSSNNG